MPVMTYKKIYASWAAVVCVFNLNTKKEVQAVRWIFRFEVSLVYWASSMTARARQRSPAKKSDRKKRKSMPPWLSPSSPLQSVSHRVY